MLDLGNKPALLIIDVQRAIDDPRWAVEGPRNNPQAEEVIAGLLAHWRGRGWPVIHIRHDSVVPGSSYAPGGPGHPFKPEAQPLPGEVVIGKTTNSAFIGTDLVAQLDALAPDSLVFAGVITNNSVEATVRMAGNLGYRSFLVHDGCFTFARRDFFGQWHGAETVHGLSLANLDGEYATVIASTAIVPPACSSNGPGC